MYFKFFKLQDWGKRSGEGRSRNCAVLPYLFVLHASFFCSQSFPSTKRETMNETT